VLEIPASSAACKTASVQPPGVLGDIDRDSATTVSFSLTADRPVSFLPGQYVNLTVPGTAETRAYSFSSAPNQAGLSFLIRDVPNGLMSGFMRNTAQAGDSMRIHRPLRQLLPASRRRPGADAGRRHRPGALPVHAALARRPIR
jgi:benzoate/toluate 1,2-dioxygenase reductase subunit